MKILSIAINTFREAIRNKILYSALAFVILIVGISAFFGAVSIGSQVDVIKDFGLFSLSFFGAIIAIIAGTSLLNKELKQKTIYNILSKPIHRYEFILGKHLGLSMSVVLLVFIMGVSLIGFVAFFEGQVDYKMFQAVACIMLEVIVVSAITIFFSAVVITTTLTSLFTLGTYLTGHSIAYLRDFVKSDNNNIFTGPLVSIVEGLDYIMPDLSVFNVNDIIVSGGSLDSYYALTAILYCLAYSLFALGFASIVFHYRELQ